jgi:Sec-independent protein secretion pathway component TatC
LPVIWSFFSAFGTSSGDYGSAGFSFELRVQDFIIFISDFIGFVSFIAVVFIVLTSLIIFRGVSSLLYWKKLFIFFNIMFATFLSPPDVYSQIVILLILSIFLEIFIFFFLLSFKVEKKYMLLVRHDVK